MDDVIAKSDPNVSPAQRSTASACSTGSAMPSNRASASAAISGVGLIAIVTAALLSRSAGGESTQAGAAAPAVGGVPVRGQVLVTAVRAVERGEVAGASAGVLCHSNHASSARAT